MTDATDLLGADSRGRTPRWTTLWRASVLEGPDV
jgi:hypothetical protein